MKILPYVRGGLIAGLLVGRGIKKSNFAGIFEASFAEKRLVKNGRFRESFPSKFRWKEIQHIKNTFTILVASSSIFFIQVHVVCLTFEILSTTILHFCNI